MASSYTTSEIDAVVRQLEASLGQGSAMVRTAEGREIQYKTNAAIRDGLAYWKGLYPTASDAPVTTNTKVRSYLFFGGKGF